MKLARAVLIASVVAFALMLVVTLRRRVDSDVHDVYVDGLARLQSLDAKVNEGVLRHRLGVTGSFDPLAEMMRRTAALHEQLRAVPAFLSAGAQRDVLAALEESRRFQVARKRNVERFEADDAALAASVRILEPETLALAAELEPRGGRALADRARTLRIEMLELAAARGPGRVAAIEDAIEALRVEAARWPEEADRKGTERLISHARSVMFLRRRVDALAAEIVTEEAMSRAVAIEAAYTTGVEAARRTSDRQVALLYVLAMLVLGSASAYVITRLRASARELSLATTQLSTALDALHEERKKEKELAELKTRFVAMTSHEFRTPLSVISSSAELLQSYGEKWGVEKRGEHLARIRRSVAGMTTMLERILLIGKTEAGMLEFRPGTVALDRLFAETAQTIEQADGGKRRVVSEIAGDLGVARADEKLMRHVLENLLSNAVKYSPEGATVRFAAAREGADVVLTIVDRGIGIPEEDRARLFDGFHRARNATHISGTGLGLAVVKRAVELHGGTIRFDSEVDRGTTFTVRMRAEREDA